MEQQIDQEVLNKKNTIFWNELCGPGLARILGLKDHFIESLKIFDAAYYGIYLYLLRYVKPHLLKNKKVLEIGLGLGILSQTIGEAGANYYGLDITEASVNMVNHRLRNSGLLEQAQKGNMLKCPFGDGYFDAVVSIGCFHHTGDIQRCFDETYRILKPGGRAVLMVYNKFSLRQWMARPKETLKELVAPCFIKQSLSDRYAQMYDADSSGAAAPEVILSSKSELLHMLRKFSKIELHKENSDSFGKIFSKSTSASRR